MNNDCQWLKDRPIAHRGLHDKENAVIENTRSAFARAIKAGFAIECDLQIARDGEAMVFHDDTLNRLTTGKGAVIKKTSRQLMETAFRKTGDKMQTLADLLDQVASAVPLVIELKSSHTGSVDLARRAVEVLKDYRGRFALMSFDPRLVAAVRFFAPHMCAGATLEPSTRHHWMNVVPDSEELPVAFASKDIDLSRPVIELIRPDFLSCKVDALPNAFSDKYRANGKPVICWTVKDQKTADYAYQYADQITFEGFDPA